MAVSTAASDLHRPHLAPLGMAAAWPSVMLLLLCAGGKNVCIFAGLVVNCDKAKMGWLRGPLDCCRCCVQVSGVGKLMGKLITACHGYELWHRLGMAAAWPSGLLSLLCAGLGVELCLSRV